MSDLTVSKMSTSFMCSHLKQLNRKQLNQKQTAVFVPVRTCCLSKRNMPDCRVAQKELPTQEASKYCNDLQCTQSHDMVGKDAFLQDGTSRF